MLRPLRLMQRYRAKSRCLVWLQHHPMHWQVIIFLRNDVSPRRVEPPLPSRKRTWRPRATGSRTTTANSSAGEPDRSFLDSRTPASISSGFFASSFGGVAQVPFHRHRRPEPTGTSADGWFRLTRSAVDHARLHPDRRRMVPDRKAEDSFPTMNDRVGSIRNSRQGPTMTDSDVVRDSASGG